MSFIQIGFLGAFAALAIPVVIHLVFRQRPKRVDLGTLRFLRIVLEHNARRRRVMRWFLLALRMACVALLAVLFARPYLLAARGGAEKQTTVILIDRSATMELKQDGVRAIDRAVAEAKELLRAPVSDTRFELAFFDHTVEPLTGPGELGNKEEKRRHPRGDELAARLKAPRDLRGATDYGAALEWARDVLAKAPPGPRRLHVFTDFQRSGLAWSEVDALPGDVSTQLHDLGRAAVNNLAVTEARAERAWLRPDEQTSLHVTVYNGGPFTTDELPITLKLTSSGRAVELREQVKLEPGAMQSLRFDLPTLPAGLWQGTVTALAEDDLPLDNARHVALLASAPYQVLLIDGKTVSSPVLASTYYLESALRLAPPGELYSAGPFEPRSVGPDEALPNLDKVDVVVLADVAALDRRDAENIAEHVNRGGGLLVFCGESMAAGDLREFAAAGLDVGPITGVSRAVDLPLRMRTWDSKHPIFAAFSDPQLGDLKRLSFSACAEIKPVKGAAVLASFGDGLPAVIERRVGIGSVVWFTSSCGRQWSDWADSRLYLPLMYQLLGHQSGLTAGGRVRDAVLDRDVAKDVAAPTAESPGVETHDRYTLVVNVSPRESETDRCSVEEFVDRFGLKTEDDSALANTEATAARQQQAGIGVELIDSEIWPWLAIALLGFVMVEALVANRTAA